mmetsp:Transcript_41584/g.90616  ORF Transcript_41584/g.90616 Transcript_41584/m.90616 type:complete len:227 (+) Transcript_41584:72-752(+)
MCRVTIQRVSAPTPFSLPEGFVANGAASEDRKRPREESHEEHEDEDHSTEGMRSGKWTREEEIYADALIEKFENGTLTDCTKGKTLRAYLSRKLNCIPMRVSKKYGGKCIGKHSYSPVSDEESAEESARMEQLAQACWESIEYRIKHRRKRVSRCKPSSDDSGSDMADSVPHSDNTDKEDLLLDDLLMGDFFTEIDGDIDFGAAAPVDENSLFDWCDLSDDCLLLL